MSTYDSTEIADIVKEYDPDASPVCVNIGVVVGLEMERQRLATELAASQAREAALREALERG